MICACSVSVPSVLVRQKLAPSTHITDESLTEHAHITYKTRTIHVCSTSTITYKKIIDARNSHKSCMKNYAWPRMHHNFLGLVRCCARNVRSLSVIVSDTCTVYTRFISDSDHTQSQKMTNFWTNNHAQTYFTCDLCVIDNGTGT